MTRNKIFHYNPKLRQRARELRKNPTLAEKILWRKIRGKQLGYEFHRQVPISQFIVDFYCHEFSLAIEIDGSSHDSDHRRKKDLERQSVLESVGVSVLRFQDDDVIRQLDAVVTKISKWIEENA